MNCHDLIEKELQGQLSVAILFSFNQVLLVFIFDFNCFLFCYHICREVKLCICADQLLATIQRLQSQTVSNSAHQVTSRAHLLQPSSARDDFNDLTSLLAADDVQTVLKHLGSVSAAVSRLLTLRMRAAQRRQFARALLHLVTKSRGWARSAEGDVGDASSRLPDITR